MAITQDWQFDLNGVTWGRGVTPPGFAAGTTLSITELSGFDHPDANSLISVRSNQHGAYISARYHQHRVWVMTGRLNTTAANFAQDTFALKQLFAAIPAGNTLPFSIKLPGMVQITSNVSPVGVKFPVQTIATAVGWVDFTATMLAGDPRIYSSATHSPPAITSGQYQTCSNAGTFDAPTVLRFVGPLTNPVATRTAPPINNMATNPQAPTSNWFGGGSNTGTNSTISDGSGPPSVAVTTYQRKTWVTSSGLPQDDVGWVAHAPDGGTPINQTVTASMWMRSNRATSITPSWTYTDGSWSGLSNTNTVALQPNTWTRVVVTIVPQGGKGVNAVDFSPYTYGTVAMAVGDWIDATATQIEFGGQAHDYVDGTLGTNYSWDSSGNLLSASAASFEDGTTGSWITIGTAPTLTNSTAQAKDGTHSLLVTWPTASAAASGAAAPSVTCSPNTTYTASCYLYAPTGAPDVTLQLNNPGVAVLASSTYTTKNGWNRVVITGVTQTTQTTLQLEVLNATAATAGQLLYVDAAQIEQRAYATPFNASPNYLSTSTYAPSVQTGFTLTMSTGDVLVVNSLLETVTFTPSGGSPTTKFGAMTAASDWMYLLSGTNQISLSAASGSGSLYLTWNDTWL